MDPDHPVAQPDFALHPKVLAQTLACEITGFSASSWALSQGPELQAAPSVLDPRFTPTICGCRFESARRQSPEKEFAHEGPGCASHSPHWLIGRRLQNVSGSQAQAELAMCSD